MRRSRLTIASMLGIILILGLIFAALRSGSNDAFKLIYSLTFVELVYAAIAARSRGPFWHGFAVAGWSYFVVGFGPWIGMPADSEALRVVNRNLITSFVLELISGTMAANEAPPAAMSTRWMFTFQNRMANRDGIGHCVLTILAALAGGWVGRALARRPRTDP